MRTKEACLEKAETNRISFTNIYRHVISSKRVRLDIDSSKLYRRFNCMLCGAARPFLSILVVMKGVNLSKISHENYSSNRMILTPSHEKCNPEFEKKNPTKSTILEIRSRLLA